jgi:hypothetical protein
MFWMCGVEDIILLQKFKKETVSPTMHGDSINTDNWVSAPTRKILIP